MKKQLVKNSISGLVQFIITALLTLYCIPLFINNLGSETYGVFAITSIIGNLSIFTNLGLNSSLIKFIAEQGKSEESDYDVTISVILVTIFLIPITFICYFFEEFILINILGIPFHFYNQVEVLYNCLLLSNLLLFVANIFGAVLSARQKTYILNYIQMIYSLIYWGLIILILLNGYNLKEIGFITLFSSIFWFIMILFFSLKEWNGKLTVIGIKLNFIRIVKKQLNYGYKIYLAGLITLLYEPLTKILIANLIGIKEVGFFEIALKIRSYVISIISKAMQPLLPLLAELKNNEKIRLLVHDLTQKGLFFALPLMLLIIFCTKPFMSMWLDHDVDIISTSIIYIAGVFLITVTSTPNFQYLTVKNLVEKTIYIQIMNVVVNALVIILFFKYIGYFSVILGNTLAILSAFSLNIYYQYKYLKSLIFDNKLQLFKFISSALISFTIVFIFNLLIIGNILKLILIPLIIVTLILFLYRCFGLVTELDINRYFYKDGWIKNKIKFVFLNKHL